MRFIYLLILLFVVTTVAVDVGPGQNVETGARYGQGRAPYEQARAPYEQTPAPYDRSGAQYGDFSQTRITQQIGQPNEIQIPPQSAIDRSTLSWDKIDWSKLSWDKFDWEGTKDAIREKLTAFGHFVRDQFNRLATNPRSVAPLAPPGAPPPAVTIRPAVPPPGGARQNNAQKAASDYVALVTPAGYKLVWPASKMPLKVFVADGKDVPNYRDTNRLVLMDALDAWSTASNGRIDWKLVTRRELSDVECSWTTRLTRRHGAWEAGNAHLMSMYSPLTGGGAIMHAKVEILTGLKRPFTDREMKRVCLHEVGHALGLQGHSNKTSDVLYPIATAGGSGDLSARDKTTIQALYSKHPPVKDFKLAKGSPRVNTTEDNAHEIIQTIQYELANLYERGREEINKVDWSAEWSKAIKKANEAVQVARGMAEQIAVSVKEKAGQMKERAEKAM